MMGEAGTTRIAPVVLNGTGRVGREFARLLSEEATEIRDRTGCLPVLRAAASIRGILFSYEGLALDDLNVLADTDAGQTGTGAAKWSWLDGGTVASRLSVFSLGDYPLVLDLVRGEVPGVVVEATPTDIETGEPGLSHIVTAMRKGFSAVTLAKGPLVVAFGRLIRLAEEKGVSLRYSGAVAAALPTVDTAMYSMAGSGIFEIEGVLNGTTNFILNSMGTGKAYSDALAEAQAMGVAEAKPRLDVEGFDSASKLLIIANTVWGCELGLSTVDRQGITGLDPAFVRECRDGGTPVRLVARAALEQAGGQGDEEEGAPARRLPKLSVRPEPVPAGHPFANLPGTAKAVLFKSRNMGDIVVSGGASDVKGAAASAIKDLIHILEERRKA